MMDDERSAFDDPDTSRGSSRDVAVPAASSAPPVVVASSPPPKPQQSSQSSPSSPTPSKAVVHTSQMDDDEAMFVSEFGFEISEKEKLREETYIKNIDGNQVIRREIKWANMTADWATTSAKQQEKLKERCRKGIPSKLRGAAWQYLLGSRAEMDNPANKGAFDALRKKKMDPEVESIIARDLGRTFPTHVLFRDVDGVGQTRLRDILHAYACIDPEVGYVQGMGFLAGTLMTQMDTEESFWALHSLMHNSRYRLREMYRPGFPMLQCFFFQLKKLMSQQIPKLFRHFEALGVDPSFFASQWFLTLFVYHFQFRAVLRVWDIFVSEGWKQIFRVAIALMKWEEDRLLAMDFEKILPALKTLHEDKNPDEILTRSLKIKFKTEELAKWQKEYETTK